MDFPKRINILDWKGQQSCRLLNFENNLDPAGVETGLTGSSKTGVGWQTFLRHPTLTTK